MSRHIQDKSTIRPLSWVDARSRLRLLLKSYLQESTNISKKEETPEDSIREKESLLSQWVTRDLDLYCGALMLSTVIFILACFSLKERHDGVGEGPLEPGASLGVYRSQVTAGFFLVVGSIVSIWTVHRRRFLCQNDGENAKKREISKFLRAWECMEGKASADSAETNTGNIDIPLELAGTALTDIYPVYRRNGLRKASKASWKRIPSLLMAEGDLIALQIGDVAPADCVFVSNPEKQMEAGERVTLQTFDQSLDDVISRLPKGRTTLEPGSEHLLSMCNKMQIFRVLKAPLAKFIRPSYGKSRPSQIVRQLKAIRKCLAVAAPVLLILTAGIVFSRTGILSGNLSLILPLPLLASVGVLPVVGPAFMFFLEVLGTARILRTIHPFSSTSLDEKFQAESFFRSRLLLQYVVVTGLSRLSLWKYADRIVHFYRRFYPDRSGGSDVFKLVRVPPASINLLEKLGIATVFALVDDELACEPHAIPQQLLIPSGKGLKLLDLCPTYDEDSDDETGSARGRTVDSDSDSEGGESTFHSTLRRKVLRRPLLRARKAKQHDSENETDGTDATSLDVQFEDPLWWQFLPSLKCIGLSCLLMEKTKIPTEIPHTSTNPNADDYESCELDGAESALVKLLCTERRSYQFRSLAECIGFSTEPNALGSVGDISSFVERLRLHILSNGLFKERLKSDAHERSSGQSRWWGVIRPDSTSVIVEDKRSNAYQLLTVGDPLVVTNLCNEAWQGETSTILPLSAQDRNTILETSKNWKLADLDVAAFGYSPVPRTLESRLSQEKVQNPSYLLDCGQPGQSVLKDKSASEEWGLVRNQIFLGVLGSLVVPRREIHKLLSTLGDAGVRFVYFSPRNMRRQKELASQMGIDVAWNCAISLRALASGEEDPHRMVSNYADWDINAKLPHGVEDVRKHLKEVDNVPLLVSLFTDATKATTKDMVDIFQEYHETAITVGLSHLPWNNEIFSTADIAVGIDILTDITDTLPAAWGEGGEASMTRNHVLPSELEFVCAIASHSCAFRFQGASSLSHLPEILEQGRAALEAVTAAAVFLVTGSLSMSFFVLFSVCTPSTTVPYVPMLGAVLYLQIILPGLGLSMAMSDSTPETMKRVPPKNDQTVVFPSRNEGVRLYRTMLLKALLPAIFPQLMHLIVFGELMLEMEPAFIEMRCPSASSWVDVVRCDSLEEYSGPARISAGVIVFALFVFCNIVVSTSFVRRFELITDYPPWRDNKIVIWALVIGVLITIVYVILAVDEAASGSQLPWYFYALSVLIPLPCLVWNEWCKREEAKQERRADKLRRLQFETRLGAWSPR